MRLSLGGGKASEWHEAAEVPLGPRQLAAGAEAPSRGAPPAGTGGAAAVRGFARLARRPDTAEQKKWSAEEKASRGLQLHSSLWITPAAAAS